MSFQSLSASLVRALTERNYAEPTPVQKAMLADNAAGRDLLVSAQTGSGKTVAFGVSISRDLLGESDRLPKAGAPLALVVTPTRELALQVHAELTWLYQHAGARVVSCVGGMDPRREQRELADGAHIVVGTPGRLCDHLRRNRLDVSELKAVVLDEADEMLDMGFREDMEFILETTPASRRTLLFSATLPRGIVNLAKQYQQNAFRVEVAGTEGGHADIEYRAIRILPGEVDHSVVNVLRFYEAQTAIVFCNTRNAVRHLQTTLQERGFAVVALSGELTQNERTTALQSLRDGHSRVCVATDVAARGIDLPNLGLVIHAELPNDAEVMQHRSGRTGRAGRKGVSILLVPPSRRRRAEMLLNLGGIDAEWGSAPTPEAIKALDQERMISGPLFSETPSDEDLALARTVLDKHSPESIAAALARLYRSRLPSPEDVNDPGDRAVRSRNVGTDDPHKSVKKRPGEGFPNGSIWFRAAVGRQQRAEARWLLPMLCRRGGIDKGDIGAIKIYDNLSEFEISTDMADKFSSMIKRPDKEDSIRIEALPNGPQGEAGGGSGRSQSRSRYDDRDDRSQPKRAYKEKSWSEGPRKAGPGAGSGAPRKGPRKSEGYGGNAGRPAGGYDRPQGAKKKVFRAQ